MRKIAMFLITFFLLSGSAFCQKEYKYITYPDDPLKTRIYTLDNGLKVYISVNKSEPRIATRIAVKAGSKLDPSDATGLAHYLEHMLFKGTDKFGTKDFSIEGKLIEEIINLYEEYRATKDPDERKNIYRKIDSVSYLASEYAIPNEYDKMLSAIGAKGTNAYTSVEQTVYTNEIPSNQFEKWVEIEAERFRNPVMRLFHTELEVVYEEKNRSLDNGFYKAYEALMSGLFSKHTYGTQTTIGTVEHLKNPSIKKVIDYYNTYYVPNNMAIILAGDINPDEAIKIIDEKFGVLKPKPIPDFIPPVEEKIKEPILKEVYSPEQEFLFMGFRLPGVNAEDFEKLEMLSSILYNGTAGLIDLNLILQQKVLQASAYIYDMKDYSVLFINATPRGGQSLDELKTLLLSQIELLKKGDFSDWYLDAVINNIKLEQMRILESNNRIVNEYVNSFTQDIPWDKYYKKIELYSKVTKQDIIDVANKYFGENYVAVYKKTGEDKTVQKIVKPEITPVLVNRDTESEFLKNIIKTPVPEIEPEFINYKEVITESLIQSKNKIYHLKNNENDLFEFALVYDMGTNNDKRLGLAMKYLLLIGTEKYSATDLSIEFYKIGCRFDANANVDRCEIKISGLNKNFKKAIELLYHLLNDCKADDKALQNLISDELKERENAKLSKNIILRQALLNYGKYGALSPFTNVLSTEELKLLKGEDITSLIKNLCYIQHKIAYYGPFSSEEFYSAIQPYYLKKIMPFDPPPEKNFPELETQEKVYYVNYKMQQVEIMMISKSVLYDAKLTPVIRLFNEYFGSGMSSVVFQELREAKALAYSVYSNFTTPREKGKSYYITSYIGTQADKLAEALDGFIALLTILPESEISFNSAKDGIIKQIQSERILRFDIIRNYLNNLRFGIDYDIRKDIYEQVPKMTLTDLKEFHQKYFNHKSYTYLVIGDKNKVDIDILKKYADFKELTLEEIFGY
ncbi:MAG: insulinase family protein [Ignavibacteria bacterium]|nr:insulinase family protein [Ignavibacteria bacterium]